MQSANLPYKKVQNKHGEQLNFMYHFVLEFVPGYTASHSTCKKTTNVRAKFYGKTALNGEIPVNKYQNNINHMS